MFRMALDRQIIGLVRRRRGRPLSRPSDGDATAAGPAGEQPFYPPGLPDPTKDLLLLSAFWNALKFRNPRWVCACFLSFREESVSQQIPARTALCHCSCRMPRRVHLGCPIRAQQSAATYGMLSMIILTLQTDRWSWRRDDLRS